MKEKIVETTINLSVEGQNVRKFGVFTVISALPVPVLPQILSNYADLVTLFQHFFLSQLVLIKTKVLGLVEI